MKTVQARLSLPLLFAILVLLMSAVLSAHPGHGEAISKDVAVQRATAEMTRLADAGKLDASWKLESTLQSAELGEKGAMKEWVVIFANEKAPKENERTLYVFLSDQGEYLAANFSGK